MNTSTYFTVCSATNGRVLRTGSVMSEEVARLQADPKRGEVLHLGQMANNEYLLDGKPTKMPERPSTAHDWDWSLHAWVENLDSARAAAVARIEEGRVAQCAAPLTFDDTTVDADPVSQSNLATKLQEALLLRTLGQSLPEDQLYWRDAANQHRAFADMQAYTAWLTGVALALARRLSDSYVWAVQQKAAVKAASLLDEIEKIA